MANGLPLERKPMPAWLCSRSQRRERVSLKDLLNDSVFYPACQDDFLPVERLAGYFRSFVYVDWMEEPPIERMLRRYPVTVIRQQTFQPMPDQWLIPPVEIPVSSGYERTIPEWMHPALPDIDDLRAENLKRKVRVSRWFMDAPIWYVIKMAVRGNEELVSLLYVRGEAVLTYLKLYRMTEMKPSVLCIIQPGHEGINWTNFDERNGFFAQMVRDNPAGEPELLLYGGYGSPESYRTPCWPEYSLSVFDFTEFDRNSPTQFLGLWALAHH